MAGPVALSLPPLSPILYLFPTIPQQLLRLYHRFSVRLTHTCPFKLFRDPHIFRPPPIINPLRILRFRSKSENLCERRTRVCMVYIL